MEENLIESVLGAVIAAVIAGVGGLFVRMRRLESRQARSETEIKGLESYEGEDLEETKSIRGDIASIQKEMHEIRLCMSDQYMKRDDFVATSSLILKSLEKQRELLARHDERLKCFSRRPQHDENH